MPHAVIGVSIKRKPLDAFFLGIGWGPVVANFFGAVQSASRSQQKGIGGPTHCPLAVQTSGPVQTRPSLQDAPVFAMFRQPLAGSHESVVQTLLSLQSTAP